MNEERDDMTIGEMQTRGPGGKPLRGPVTREKESVETERRRDSSQTIGELPTVGPKEPDLTLLAKRYRVVRRLGEGGMGSVWLAEDTKLDNRLVAVKMLPAVLAGKKGAYRQVKQEALMAMKLSHPNIATVRAFEEESGNPFLVMDYIDGEGLDDILDDKGKLSEAETLKLLTPVAAALDYAHGKGVVHRDVKPGNVMVAKDGTPFVLDFGIAREIQETMTRVTGKFSSGTLMYMSPEQLHGKQPRAAQDVYSFAAMAYECLKGEPPFAHGQVEYQIDHDVPEPLEAGMASVALGEGIMAGLSKDPQARPATCAEVLGLGEAAKRTREAREAAEAARRRQEEARLAQERARAEAEKRREEKALAEERAARKLAEAKTEKAREEAKKQAMEAFRAQEAQGRASRWIGFLVFVLIVAGVAGALWWQGEKERLEGNLRDARRQKAELEQQRSQWEDKARKAAGEAEAAKVARQNLERQQAELERQRVQQEEAAKAAELARQLLEAQRAEQERQRAQREAEAAEAARKKAKEEAQRRREAEDLRRQSEEEEARRQEQEARQATVAFEVAPRTASSASVQTTDEVIFPGGVFTLGRAHGEGPADETPAVSIQIAPFAMANTPVTVAQFRAFVADTGYITTAERMSDPLTWKTPGFAQTDDDPVVCVSWLDAVQYCNWRSKRARLTPAYAIRNGGNSATLNPKANGYRLPLEAEWEYAARNGGRDILFPWGTTDIEDESTATSRANFTPVEIPIDPWPNTNPVKAFPADPSGLYGMAGNVWEWCQDMYNPNAYVSAYRTGDIMPLLNPDPRDCPNGIVSRVIRGGSYRNPLPLLRCTARARGFDQQIGRPHVGMRLARNAD